MHRYGSREDLFVNMLSNHAGPGGECDLLFMHEIGAGCSEMS